MLTCQGGCLRRLDEYYILPDGKVFCYDCWRRGYDGAKQRGKEIVDSIAASNRHVKESEKELEHVTKLIDIEKHRFGRQWSDWDNRESWQHIDEPFNYADVQKLELRARELREQISNHGNSWITRPPLSTPPSYYTNAKFISREQSHFYETIELPRLKAIAEEKARKTAEELKRQQEELNRRKEEERQKKEAEDRIKAEQEKKLREELLSIEEAMLRKEKVDIRQRCRVAKQTNRLDVLKRCARDSAKTVREAALSNPALTSQLRDIIVEKQVKAHYANATHASALEEGADSSRWKFGCLFGIIILAVAIISFFL